MIQGAYNLNASCAFIALNYSSHLNHKSRISSCIKTLSKAASVKQRRSGSEAEPQTPQNFQHSDVYGFLQYTDQHYYYKCDDSYISKQTGFEVLKG